MNRLIDLSHPLEPGMPAYPGLPVPQFRTWMTHAVYVGRVEVEAATGVMLRGALTNPAVLLHAEPVLEQRPFAHAHRTR